MLLNAFLGAGYHLFENTRDIFDGNLLVGRISAIYGTRTMRNDCTPAQIEQIGQNVIDCNQSILEQLFDYAEQFNPTRQNQTTTTKTGDKTDIITDDTTRKNTGDRTTTNNTTDTTTNTGTTTTTGNTSDTPNNVVSLTKSAYNATEQKPAETTTTTGTNTATSTATATDDLTAKTQKTGTITNTDDLTETNSRDYTLHNTYSDTSTTYGVSGTDEIRAAFDKFIAPYDYLAKILTAEVCELIW